MFRCTAPLCVMFMQTAAPLNVSARQVPPLLNSLHVFARTSQFSSISSFLWSQRPPFGGVGPRGLWSTPEVSVWWREVRASTRSALPPLPIPLGSAAQHILWRSVCNRKRCKTQTSSYVFVYVIVHNKEITTVTLTWHVTTRRLHCMFWFFFSVKWSQLINAVFDKPLFFPLFLMRIIFILLPVSLLTAGMKETFSDECTWDAQWKH